MNGLTGTPVLTTSVLKQVQRDEFERDLTYESLVGLFSLPRATIPPCSWLLPCRADQPSAVLLVSNENFCAEHEAFSWLLFPRQYSTVTMGIASAADDTRHILKMGRMCKAMKRSCKHHTIVYKELEHL